MKTFKLIAMSFAVGSLFYSCSTERELETENSQKLENSLAGRDSKACEIFENAVESSTISGVKAINFDNGLPTTCNNNILIFPTLQAYGEAITKLDQLIEDHNNDFDLQTAGMTDVQADDYADAVGFDENAPLSKFEDEMKFCSLRKYLEELDNDWLSQQTDGAWNLNTAPDEYFIDDETERALLSLGAEFIVGDCKNGYTLYKRFDWGFVSFPIDDPSTVSQILTALNNISNPTQQPFNTTGATPSQVYAALDPYKGSVNYTVTNNTPPPASQLNCRSVVKDKGEHVFSSDRRIMWKHKLKDAQFPNVTGFSLIKTYTRSFRKKKGKWKTYRATIFTGRQGKTQVFTQCTDYGTEPLDGKERKRKKVKDRYLMLGDIAVKQNLFFSVHKQEGNSYQNDVY